LLSFLSSCSKDTAEKEPVVPVQVAVTLLPEAGVQIAWAGAADNVIAAKALAATTAVQRQVEALGSDLAAALQLIAERALALTWATGSAIALRSEITRRSPSRSAYTHTKRRSRMRPNAIWRTSP